MLWTCVTIVAMGMDKKKKSLSSFLPSFSQQPRELILSL